MFIFREVRQRIKFWLNADRLGPDILATHWRLYFPTTMRAICKKKFRHFGNNADFRPGAYAIACSKISIGSNVVIRPGTMLSADTRDGDELGTIEIDDDVLLGPGIHIYVDNHAFHDLSIPVIEQGHYPTKPVKVERGAWIGAGVIILPGCSIGRNAIVGAGSIVTKDVPPFSVAVGNPACVVKNLTTPEL